MLKSAHNYSHDVTHHVQCCEISMTNNISETDKSNIFCNNNITVRIHKSNCLKSKVVLYDGHMAHYMSSSSDPINTDMILEWF